MTLYQLDGTSPKIPGDGDYWVAPDANVIGKVDIGSAVGIWFGVTLRGHNEWLIIGEGTNVQENVVMHTDMGYPLTIGRNCTIGHKAMLHGCTLGDNCLIGMGATVLNGAVIGDNCLIGAGALITEGKVIPEGSLVMGAPGKMVRQLDQAARKRLVLAAEGYQANMRRFRNGLKAV